MDKYIGHFVPLSEASRTWNKEWYKADEVDAQIKKIEKETVMWIDAVAEKQVRIQELEKALEKIQINLTTWDYEGAEKHYFDYIHEILRIVTKALRK